ncbi:MAG: SDR family NAD(P)-dependent oxidoreductase [Solirubrobacteraceae bacterium]|nr:SDR family NAD(P)-dependent oxidoreductase [Solirubrobacteraceae bacterium]
MTRKRANGLALVTGASSGIGAATAVELAQRGFRVLAGVRNLADADPLVATCDGIEPILLDITNADHIQSLKLRLGLEPLGLSVLVNNAGVLSVGPVELIADQRWEEVVGVNITGTIAVTRAAIPAIVRAKGRIVNVSSPTGRLALPMFGPYSVSKFALEALNDTLRRELRGAGVRVICVTPGMIITPIFDKGISEGQDVWDAHVEIPEMQDRYGRLASSALKAGDEARTVGKPPAAAAALIARAVTTRYPRSRYRMGFENHMANVLPRIIPDRLLDVLLEKVATADFEVPEPEIDLADLSRLTAATAE